MTFESLTKYTDESIKSAKELQKFLTAKSQLDIEYAQKIIKLCQSTSAVYSVPADKTAKGSKETEKNFLLSSSLWKSFNELLQQISESSFTMKTVANNIMNEITTPMLQLIKEMEIVRKEIVDNGTKQTNLLQDQYTTLKKAKQQLDDTSAAFNESKEALLKAQRAPNTKEKELDKLNQKVQQFSEKHVTAEENFKDIDDACKNAQQIYFQRIIPEILQNLYSKEEERCVTLHNILRNWSYMEKQFSEYKNKSSDWILDKVETADITGDMEDLFTEYMNAAGFDDDSSKFDGLPSISVRSLVNPIKAGRIAKKADENNVSWKPRYFVLMGDRLDPLNRKYQAASGRLYYFETEDALKPKGIIDLSVASVFMVHDSLFPGKQNLFVISTTLTTTEDNALVTKHKTYYLSAESSEERDHWFKVLKRYSLCCMPCICKSLSDPVSLNLDKTERVVANFPKATSKEIAYRTIKSLHLYIMEARDLNFLEPLFETSTDQVSDNVFFGFGGQKQQIYPFCVISANDMKIAKTTVKTAGSPFWGEEFFFDELADCETDFRISVLLHTRRRDAELGYVEFKLSQVQDAVADNHVHKKVEFWMPLQGFTLKNNSDEDNTTTTMLHANPAIRIQAVLTDECILPLHEYPIFVNCLFAEDFKVLKTIATSAEKCTSFARDDFARSLISILCATETDVTAFRALLTVDVEATDDPNIIFRGNSLATKSIDQYMKFIGSEFLKNTLSGPIKLVYERANRQESCEVDSTRLDRVDDEILKKHQKRLLVWVQVFWDAIQGSIENAPRNLRETLQSIREMVQTSFERKKQDNAHMHQVQFSAVSGFIFLRFFCPAILNPKLFGLWPEVSENPVASRTLTLIAKVIQNLANLSDFKSKEPHMEFCNQWILWNMDAMKTTILQFSTTPSGNDDRKAAHRYAFLFTDQTLKIDLSREFNYLFLHIQNNFQDLKQVHDDVTNNSSTKRISHGESYYRRIDPSSLVALFSCLEAMDLMYARYDLELRKQRKQLEISPHLEKQFTLMNFANSLEKSHTQDDKKRLNRRSSATPKKLISTPTLINSSNYELGESIGNSLIDLGSRDDPDNNGFPSPLSSSNLKKADSAHNSPLSRRRSESRAPPPVFNAEAMDVAGKATALRISSGMASPKHREISVDFGKDLEEELNRKLEQSSLGSLTTKDNRPSVTPRAGRPSSIFYNNSGNSSPNPSRNTVSIPEESNASNNVGKRFKKWLSGKKESDSGEITTSESADFEESANLNQPTKKFGTIK